MEGVISDGLLTGSTQEAVDVPCLLEGIDHFLDTNTEVSYNRKILIWRDPINKTFFVLIVFFGFF